MTRSSPVRAYEATGVKGPFTALLVIGCCAYLALVGIFWVGFLGSDDGMYWGGAGGWLAHFPYVGDSHWTLRHTLVVPLALARAILGDGLAALSLPTLLYALGVIAILTVWLRGAVGIFAATAAIALVITDPQFVLLSSTADVDIPELFFIICAFFVLDRIIAGQDSSVKGRAKTSPWLALLSVGVLLALGLISRETTIFAIAAVGLLFLAGYGMKRSLYFVTGIGFAVITGLEFLWLWSRTGRLFYRYNIDLHHDSTINRWLDQGAAIPFVHPLVDPVTMLLLNHNFALLGWIGVPLTIWLVSRAAPLNAATRRLVVLVGTLSLTWALLAAGLWKLLPLIPRYYLLPSVGVAVLAGVASGELWQGGRRRLAVCLGLLLVLGNLAALAVDNRNFMFGEHTLVDLAVGGDSVIHTDPVTLRRASLLLEWRKVRNRVNPAPPGKGELFFYNPARAGSNLPIGADWSVVNRRAVPTNVAQWLACNLVPARAMPSALSRRCAPSYVTLYRVI